MRLPNVRIITIILKTIRQDGQSQCHDISINLASVEQAGQDAVAGGRNFLIACRDRMISLINAEIKKSDPRATINANEKSESIKVLCQNLHNYAAFDGIGLALNGAYNPDSIIDPCREIRSELEWFRSHYIETSELATRLKTENTQLHLELHEHKTYCVTRPKTEEFEKAKSEAASYKEAFEKKIKELLNLNDVIAKKMQEIQEKDAEIRNITFTLDNTMRQLVDAERSRQEQMKQQRQAPPAQNERDLALIRDLQRKIESLKTSLEQVTKEKAASNGQLKVQLDQLTATIGGGKIENPFNRGAS